MNKHSKNVYTSILLLSAIATIAGYSFRDIIQLGKEFYLKNKTQTLLQKDTDSLINNNCIVNSIIPGVKEDTIRINNSKSPTILQQETNIFINNIPNINQIAHEIENNMVYVDGGEFIVKKAKSNNKEVNVKVKSFYISKYEVTQREWKGIMGTNPSCFSDCEDCPVENVSMADAKLFIDKLNNLTKKTYRLPTKKEWKFAAIGGNKSNHYKYSGSNTLGDVAWYGINSNNKTHPVGGKQCNELGLYDMNGNVDEWIEEEKLYDEYYPNIGGNFGLYLTSCMSMSYDIYYSVESSNNKIGFRLCR